MSFVAAERKKKETKREERVNKIDSKISQKREKGGDEGMREERERGGQERESERGREAGGGSCH